MEIILGYYEKVESLMLHAWHQGSLSDYLLALTVFCIFLFLKGSLTRFILGCFKFVIRKTKWKLTDEQVNYIHGPLSLLPIAIGVAVAARLAPFEQDGLLFLSQVTKTFVTISVFWLLFVLVDHIDTFLNKWERVLSKAMALWIGRVVEIIIVLLGGAAILELWGIEVAPIIASLGLFGVAVALGAQDLFKNLIAGMLVIAERRFNPGDWIKVNGVVEGTVEHIGFRSTLVRQFDKAPVYVPNTKFSDNAVTNYSGMTHRRIYWKIGVVYNTSIDQLKQVRDAIEAYVHQSNDFANPTDVSTFVRVDSFNDSSIDLMLYCFTNTTNWGEWLEIKENLAYKIKEIIEEAGTDFAFPSRTLYVDFAGDAPESFIPPSTQKKG